MVDYEYYCDEFGGLVIEDAEEFEALASKAEQFINYISSQEPDYDSDDVKSCVCAIAEIYAENSGLAGIVSEQIDGYETEDSDTGLSGQLMHAASLYLPPMLIWRGI